MGSKEELIIEASDANLAVMQEFLEQKLEELDFSMRDIMQVAVSAEEIFVNIAHYAYAPLQGKVKVTVEVTDDPPRLNITFADNGFRYNPLEKEDPDITLPAEKRKIGGLGIFIMKKMMDHAHYEYRDGQNILTISKDIPR